MADDIYVITNPNAPIQADLWKDVVILDSNGNPEKDNQGRTKVARYVVRGSVGVSDTEFNTYKQTIEEDLNQIQDDIEEVASRPAGLRIVNSIGELDPDDSALLPLSEAQNNGIPYSTELENLNVSVLADLHVISELGALSPGDSGLITIANLVAAGVPYTNDVDLSGYATTEDIANFVTSSDVTTALNTALANYVTNTSLTDRSLDIAVKNVRGKTVALTGTTINCSTGSSFTKTVTSNITLAFTNATQDTVVTLVLTNGGSATVTYPSSVIWEGGTAPELTASGTDILNFYTYNGGTTWIGSAVCDVKASA